MVPFPAPLAWNEPVITVGADSEFTCIEGHGESWRRMRLQGQPVVLQGSGNRRRVGFFRPDPASHLLPALLQRRHASNASSPLEIVTRHRPVTSASEFGTADHAQHISTSRTRSMMSASCANREP